jgi:hypothetical protein
VLELRGRIWSFLGGNPDLRTFLGKEFLDEHKADGVTAELSQGLSFSIWYKVDCADDEHVWIAHKSTDYSTVVRRSTILDISLCL